MRIVAIRALNHAFIDAMLHGHFKLRTDRRVAGVAEFGLLLREQEFRCRGFMDGMAVRADHIGFGVG